MVQIRMKRTPLALRLKMHFVKFREMLMLIFHFTYHTIHRCSPRPLHYTSPLISTLRSKTQLRAILTIKDHILRLEEDIAVNSLSDTIIRLDTAEADIALRSEVDEGTRHHSSVAVDVDGEIR